PALQMHLQLQTALAELRKAGRTLLRDEPVGDAVSGGVEDDRSQRDVAHGAKRESDRWSEQPLSLANVVESATQIRKIIAEAVELHDLELRHVAVYRNVDVGFLEPLVERRPDAHAIARRRLRDVRRHHRRVGHVAETVLVL